MPVPPQRRFPVPPPAPDILDRVDGEDWVAAIYMAEAAIDLLLDTVRRTRAVDFRMETTLWRRHHGELWAMKRKLDAVVM